MKSYQRGENINICYFLVSSLLQLSTASAIRVLYEISPTTSINLRELATDLVTPPYNQVKHGYNAVLRKGKPSMALSLQYNFCLSDTTEFEHNVLELILVENVNDVNNSILQVTEDVKVSSWRPTFFLWPELFNSRYQVVKTFEHYAIRVLTKARLNSNVFVIYSIRKTACLLADCLEFSLWEAYSVAGNVVMNEVHLENDELSTLMEISSGIIRRKNARQGLLKAISVNDSGWENETKFRQRKGNETDVAFEGGYAVQMLWVIRDLFNFSVQAMSGNWTKIKDLRDGTSCLVGNGRAVATGQADISISQHALNLRYIQHGLYLLHPTNSAGLRLFFIQPEMSHYRDIFLTPFEKGLWLTIFGVFIIIITTLKFFGWILHYVQAVDDENNRGLVEDAFVWGVAVITQQGFHVEPSSISIRIVFFFGYITGLVCFVAYSAQIVSTLSVKSVPIHTAEDILNGAFHLYANQDNTPKPLVNYILKEREGTGYPESVFIDEREAIRRIVSRSNDLLALITEPDIFYAEAGALNCTNKEICETFSSIHLNRAPIKGGMFVAKGSPYTEWFNYAIILMLERGLNHHFVSDYNRRTRVVCIDEKKAFVHSVKISDIVSAYKILLSGYISSLFMLACELAVVYSWRRVAHRDGYIT